jgi:hypothetical protein
MSCYTDAVLSSTALRHVIKSKYADRADSAIEKIFNPAVITTVLQVTFLGRFWAIMRATFAGIHGSVPAWVVFVPHPKKPDLRWLPRNLNIAIPFGTLARWHTFLMSEGAAPPVQLDVYASAQRWVDGRYRYVMPTVCDHPSMPQVRQSYESVHRAATSLLCAYADLLYLQVYSRLLRPRLTLKCCFPVGSGSGILDWLSYDALSILSVDRPSRSAIAWRTGSTSGL